MTIPAPRSLFPKQRSNLVYRFGFRRQPKRPAPSPPKVSKSHADGSGIAATPAGGAAGIGGNAGL
jgi:hypothetical protein